MQPSKAQCASIAHPGYFKSCPKKHASYSH
jgi:hypothetical protein